MDERGLISVEYDIEDGIATFVFDRDAPYDLDELLVYVAIMSEGNAKRLRVLQDGIAVEDVRLKQ